LGRAMATCGDGDGSGGGGGGGDNSGNKGEINRQRMPETPHFHSCPIDLLPVERGHCRRRLLLALHVHKAEPHVELAGRDGAVRAERLQEELKRRAKTRVIGNT
jgi:hypothetical protein